MKRLSDDALWLWHELDELGLEALDDENLCKYIGGDEDIWSASRLEATIVELEEWKLLSRDNSVVDSAHIHQGTATVNNGALISVTIKVFSSTEMEIAESPASSIFIDEIAALLIDSGRPIPARTNRAIYWCSTQDGDEDWFVVARNARSACSFHEEVEGYDVGDAKAEWVVDVPDSLTLNSELECDRPSDELLEACGGEFLPFHPDMDPEKVALRQQMSVRTTAVRFNGRIFVSGDVVENASRRRPKPGPDMAN